MDQWWKSSIFQWSCSFNLAIWKKGQCTTPGRWFFARCPDARGLDRWPTGGQETIDDRAVETCQMKSKRWKGKRMHSTWCDRKKNRRLFIKLTRQTFDESLIDRRWKKIIGTGSSILIKIFNILLLTSSPGRQRGGRKPREAFLLTTLEGQGRSNVTND